MEVVLMASIKDLKRMCSTYTGCGDCPLYGPLCAHPPEKFSDTADEIVDKWVSEHPVKTYIMDFLGKFPNAQVDRYKTPKVCRVVIYGNICPKECHIVSSCADCWNMEMTEQ